MVRHIRLREFPPNETLQFAPTEDYLAACDDSIVRKEYTAHTDENGFIRSSSERIGDERPIVYLGGSIVENLFVDDDQRAAVWLERRLTAHGLHIPVLNGGISGSSTLDLYNVLVTKVLPLDPCAVVLTSGVSDLLWSRLGPSLWAKALESKRVTSRPAVRRRSFLGTFAEREAALTLFRSTCEAFSLPFVLTTWGFTPRAAGCPCMQMLTEASFDWVAGCLAINEETRRFAETHNVPLIDLAASMQNREEFFYDGLHPNSRGCEAIGALIGADLITLLKPYKEARGNEKLRFWRKWVWGLRRRRPVRFAEAGASRSKRGATTS